MEKNVKNIDFGPYIKSVIEEQSLSVRKLGRLTGINAACLSRIINGKQSPSLHHLIQIASCLNKPLCVLLSALGVEENQILDEGRYYLLSTIQEILITFGIDIFCVVDDIKRELARYGRYAKTEEGKKIIQSSCMAKIKETDDSSLVINRLRQMYDIYTSDDAKDEEKAVLGGALLYFVLKTDIIPDNVFPIGYLDDAIAIKLATESLEK